METIAIQVPSEIAQAYSNVSLDRQAKIQEQIIDLLKNSVSQIKLQTTMDKLSAEAQANGLTPEILTSILNE